MTTETVFWTRLGIITSAVIFIIALFLDGLSTWFLLEVVGGFREANTFAAGLFSNYGTTAGLMLFSVGKAGLAAMFIAIAYFIKPILSLVPTSLFAGIHFYGFLNNYAYLV